VNSFGFGSRAQLTFRPSPVTLPAEPVLLAGSASVDITPPPGLPRAGYSRNAHTGVGFRTRLRARVVHLRAGTTSLAVITTDLLGGSAVVQQMVAADVAAATDVPLAGVFLGATHTHGAPGQFHGTDFYNRFSSNKPGFDPRWTAFVASQISSAVVSAVASRVPARLAWGQAEVPGLTRNRSLPAYLRNETSSPPVNPSLSLLRVDTADGSPLAALGVYSIHGTCVPMDTSTYNADLFSYVCSSFSSLVPGPVVGMLQGTHGDQTPALSGPAGHPEAARIGGLLGAAAASLYTSLESSLTSSVSLSAGFRELPLQDSGLPSRPAVGAALVAGAKENETPIVTLIPPFRAGYGKRFGGRGPQGAKWVLGSRWLQPLMLPLAGFPRVLPLHVLRIGSVALAGVPFEVTLESGRRFATAVSAGFGDASPVRTVVSSVADEYAGYCTTSEEYGAQYYEGGHTLYGPRTQAFTAGALHDLAGAVRAAEAPSGAAEDVVSAMVQDALPERSFSLRVRAYLPPDWCASVGDGAAAADGAEVPVGQLRLSGAPRRGADRRTGEVFAEWRLTGPAPHLLRWHEPMVRLDTPSGPVLDNGDGSLEIVHLGGPVAAGSGSADGSPNGFAGRVAKALRSAPARLRRRGRPEQVGKPGEHRYAVRWYPGASPADLAGLDLHALA
jgi:neutral ceramidase